MTAVYTEKPESMTYMPLPDGKADVWLRQNIEEVETEDGIQWQCEEISFRTSLGESEIVENLNTIWENGGIAEEAEEAKEETEDASEVEKELEIVEVSNLTMAAYIANLLNIVGEEGEELVNLYVLMINKGVITVDDVPAKWKTAVKAALEEA